MSKLELIRGKVWKFGDNISTTDITPHEMFLGVQCTLKEMVFAGIRPDWKDKVKPGDCIVAGRNFGFASSRYSANEVMKDLEIGCIVADSFARNILQEFDSSRLPAFCVSRGQRDLQ